MVRCPAEKFTDDMSYGARLLIARGCIFKTASENGYDYVAAWEQCTRGGCLGDIPIERLRADAIEQAANLIATHAALVDMGVANGWDEASLNHDRKVVVRLVDFLRWLTESWRE